MQDLIEKLHKAEAEYNIAVGQFVAAWADTETELYRVLIHYAGVSDAVGRAIFSGTRASAMASFLRAIAHNTRLGGAQIEDLDFVLSHLSAINTMRDRVIHFTSASFSFESENPSNRVISNQHRVSRYGKHFVHIVSSETLDNMTYDLWGISNHLHHHHNIQGEFRPWEENPGERTTWRYRPL